MTQTQQCVSHSDDFSKHKHALKFVTQTRMWIGREIVPGKGPFMGQYVCNMEKSRSVYIFYFFSYNFWRLCILFEMTVLISLEGIRMDQNGGRLGSFTL